MKIYWTRASIPELKSLSHRERTVVWNASYRKAYRHWQTWAAWLGYIAFVCLGVWTSGRVLGEFQIGESPTVSEFLNAASPRAAIVVAFAGIGLLVVDQVIATCARPYLAEFTHARYAPRR